MNFAKFYIGDYQRDTGTLTLAQHGAYMLMLMEFYATEKPIPEGRELHRLLRADSKAERDAIDYVVAKFWTRTETGLINARGMKEIERAANQRAINQEIGKRGGRPKRTEPKTDSVSETEPIKNPNQTPDTRHQTNPQTPGKRGRGDAEGFEAFWEAYPRKTAKADALKAWSKLSPDEPLRAVILAAVQAQSLSDEWTRDGGRFVPHGATWLNGRRWEDEASAAPAGDDLLRGAL